MTDYRSTTLLTEHLGYPPLTLIDHVINAVNHISYKCIEALEKYLNERKQQHNEISRHSGEIETGTAKLETLLEAQIDRNFDKFELYAFRNIFTIPNDLVEEGWLRLKHHENMDFSAGATPAEQRRTDAAIKKTLADIDMELKLRKILKLQLVRADRLVASLRQFKTALTTVLSDSNDSLSPEGRQALKSLHPMSDNLHFILSQVDELLAQVLHINSRFMKSSDLDDLDAVRFAPSARDQYLAQKTIKLLESVGVLGAPQEKLPEQLPSYSTEDVEKLRRFNSALL